MRDVQGIPGDEVAKKLGISRAAMKSRLRRAREQMRTQVDAMLVSGAAAEELAIRIEPVRSEVPASAHTRWNGIAAEPFFCLDKTSKIRIAELRAIRIPPARHVDSLQLALTTARCLVSAALLVFGVVLSGTSDAQNRRGITAEDYFSIETISDPHISPDGKTVAYVLTTVDQAKNRRDSSIWFVPADASGAPARQSAEGLSCKSPRWSPDGKSIAYLGVSNSDPTTGDKGKSQIYISPANNIGSGVAVTKPRDLDRYKNSLH